MTSIILTTICALALNAAPAPALADTLHVFIINNVPVPDFDGSQLVGKTISSYKVSRSEMGETPVVFHSIGTSDGTKQASVAIFSADESGNAPSGEVTMVSLGDKIKVSSFSPSGSPDGIVYIVDGRLTSPDDFKKLDAKDVKSMEVMKGTSAAKYLQDLKDQGRYQGDVNASEGVISVTLKKGARQP